MSSSQAARAPRHRRARRLRRTTTAAITVVARTAAPSSQAMSLTSSVLTLWRGCSQVTVALGDVVQSAGRLGYVDGPNCVGRLPRWTVDGEPRDRRVLAMPTASGGPMSRLPRLARAREARVVALLEVTRARTVLVAWHSPVRRRGLALNA